MASKRLTSSQTGHSFADERTLNAAAHLGLAHDDSAALAKQVEELLPSKDADEKRSQFTKIVDALVGIDLEHKYEECEEVMAGEAKAAEKEEEDGGPEKKVAKTE